MLWSGRFIPAVLLLAATYGVVGRASVLLAIPPGYATPIWPAAGVALAALLIGGSRLWPGILMGSFLVNASRLIPGVPIGRSLLIAFAIAVGASLQALLGARLIRRFVGLPTELVREADIWKFLALGGPLSCVVSASIGVATLAAGGL